MKKPKLVRREIIGMSVFSNNARLLYEEIFSDGSNKIVKGNSIYAFRSGDDEQFADVRLMSAMQGLYSFLLEKLVKNDKNCNLQEMSWNDRPKINKE